MDAARCGDAVFAGDVLIAINGVTVRHWPHDDVVNLLRRCRPRRLASLTLLTSHRDFVTSPHDESRDPQPRTMTSPGADQHSQQPQHRVDYNDLYRRIYSPLPFVCTRVMTSSDMHRGRGMTSSVTSSNGGRPDVVLASRYSAPSTTTPDIVVGGGSPAPRRLQGTAVRPRRSLPAKPPTTTTYPLDLLSPAPVPRRMSRRQSSQTSLNSLNFSGTPDFIPASAYIDDDDRRRRATGRLPTADYDDELAALTLNDQVLNVC